MKADRRRLIRHESRLTELITNQSTLKSYKGWMSVAGDAISTKRRFHGLRVDILSAVRRATRVRETPATGWLAEE